jgi:hypothetical protein
MSRGRRACRYHEILPALKYRLVLHPYPELACLTIMSTLPHELASQEVPSSLFRNMYYGRYCGVSSNKKGVIKEKAVTWEEVGRKGS